MKEGAGDIAVKFPCIFPSKDFVAFRDHATFDKLVLGPADQNLSEDGKNFQTFEKFESSHLIAKWNF